MKPFALKWAFALTITASVASAHEMPVTKETPPQELQEILVEEQRQPQAATEQVFKQPIIELRPVQETGDILEVVPGLITIQHAGGGKANQYYLRGFDNDHGTDIAFSVDDVPVNMVSHGHGQGYSDFNFVIPALVDSVEARKGPYFAQDGDFATAGAVNVKLLEKLEANQLTFEGGRFDTFHGTALLGTDDGKKGFYIASDVYTTNGPFLNPDDFVRFNLFARGRFESGNWKGVFTGSYYSGTWNASGQIPLPLVESGQLSRFGTLDPSDGGESHRQQVYAQISWEPNERQSFHLTAYGFHYDLDLFSNFTFFLDDPVNGDQIEQRDRREVLGYKAEYSRLDRAGGVGFRTTVGNGLRFDRIHNQLNHTTQRNFLSATTDNKIRQLNPYVYAQEEFLVNDWFRFVGALRADVLNYNVTDLLGNGVQGDKAGVVLSPKATAIFSPLDQVDVFLNFGQGFHSNDARGVLDPTMPASKFAKATGAEFGLTLKPFQRLKIDLAGWYLHLTSELVFVGDEGITEAKGPTKRYGADVTLHYHILDWLWADLDFTYAHARFTDLPSGQNFVPLAPRWTFGGGIYAKHPSGFYGSLSTVAISSRPANEDDSLTASGFMVWDLMAGYRREGVRALGGGKAGWSAQLDILNLFNANYRESQFDTTSRPDPLGPDITAIHFTPGYPFTVLGSASLFF